MGYYDGTFANYEITSKDPDAFLVFIAGLLMLVCTILGFKIRFHDDDKKVPKSIEEGHQEDGSTSSGSSNNSSINSSTNISTTNISTTNNSTSNISSNNITNGSVKKQDGRDDDISEGS